MKNNDDPEKQKGQKTPKRLKDRSAGPETSELAPPGPVKVRERIAETGGHLQDRLQEVAETAAEGAVRCADSYVQLASDRVREIEQTGHEAARKLSQHQPEALTGTINYLANHIGSVADYFENRDASDILNDTRRLVRDHPVPMLGAFALLGIAAGRILIADAANPEE